MLTQIPIPKKLLLALLFTWSITIACAINATPTPLPTIAPYVKPTQTGPTPTASITPVVITIVSHTQTPTPTATLTASTTPPPSPTATASATPSATPTITPSATTTPTPSATLTSTAIFQPPTATAITPPTEVPADIGGPITGSYGLATILNNVPYPVDLTHAGDQSNRLFIANQDGRIYVYQFGGSGTQIFLDITSKVIYRDNEQGLLGLAFHPDYAHNGLFYVSYVTPDVSVVVERYRVSASNPNQADPTSGAVLLSVPQYDGRHNGGQLAFGQDGYLYVGLGDGGEQGDPNRNAQNLGLFLGKILRLDVDSNFPYSVPPGNPFFGRQGARGEIWAYGLRNPWRFSFDRLRGDLWIADVGHLSYEEIDLQRAGTSGGVNYGWPFMEAESCLFNSDCHSIPNLTRPAYSYDHGNGTHCAVIGGYVYRGSRMPDLYGAYVFADFCSGRVWALRIDPFTGERHIREILSGIHSIASFGEDESGEVYIVQLTGAISRLVAN